MYDANWNEVDNVKDAKYTDYRYYGANDEKLKNYVTFNNETWRIIGVVTTENANNETVSLVKIMRNESASMKWDESNNDTWTRPATLNTYLNGKYLSGTLAESEKLGVGAGRLGLNKEAREMVEPNTTWYITAQNTMGTSRNNELYKERNNYTYTSGEETKNITATKWKGTVGLMNPSDYGYAAPKGCTSNLGSYINANCSAKDWIHIGANQWTLSARSGSPYNVWYVYNNGNFDNYDADGPGRGVRPVVYLKSDVHLIGNGDGSIESPYIIGA